MDKIWKVNYDKPNIHICSFCHNYIKSTKCKSILIKTKLTNKDTKCHICDRFINQINSGPNIIKFINKNRSKNDMLLNIARYKVWYFNGIFDNFGYYLKDRFKFSHKEIQNIYQAINELYALPNINIINEKATDIYNKYILP
jgi:hypothetical protein